MKLKLNYFLIPLVVLAVSVLGMLFTLPSVTTWYTTLNLPSFTPAGMVIGLVWTVLYALIAIALVIAWNKLPHDHNFQIFTAVFILNGFLNALWSYTFFAAHQIGLAILVCAALAITTYMLVYSLWKPFRTSAYLLIPYAAWVTFATYLNYAIYTLNK